MKFKEKYREKSYICLTSFLHFCYKFQKNKHQKISLKQREDSFKMKKALVLLLALSMVFGAFADEPVANVNVSEFKGEAAVQWGVDLDSGKTGFKNEAKVTMKLNLIDGGDKSSTGEGVWGEIKIKTDGDTFTKVEGNDVEFGALTIPAKIKVDTAKLHFGDNAYIGIMSGDTLVGEYKLDTAVAAEQIANPNTGAHTKTDADGNITKQYSAGIVAGYGNDIFSVDVDFRSSDETQYSNAYSLAIDGSVKLFDENLTLKGGYSKDFANPYDEDVDDAFYVATDYKLGLNDTFYIKPQVGYVQYMMSNTDDADKKTSVNNGNLVAALLFGWGDKADDKPGVYFLDKDEDGKNSKKVTPGISVAMSKTLVYNEKYDGDVEKKGVESPMSLAVSFFSGKIVDNLTAAAYFATDIGKTKLEDKDGNTVYETKKAEGYEFAAGLKYKLTAGEGSITPQFGIAMANKGYATKTGVINYSNTKYNGDNDKADAKDVLNIKAGAEFKGYVENTAFSVTYQSKNLKNTEEKDNKGTLNFKVKISL